MTFLEVDTLLNEYRKYEPYETAKAINLSGGDGNKYLQNSLAELNAEEIDYDELQNIHENFLKKQGHVINGGNN